MSGSPALSRLRANDVVLLAVVALVPALGYGVFRTVFSETDSPFGKRSCPCSWVRSSRCR